MPLFTTQRVSTSPKTGPKRPENDTTLPVGTVGYSVRLKEPLRGPERETAAESRPLVGMLGEYQAEADRAGVSLETALRTLPRAGMAIETVYSADMKAAKVRVWLEETLPSYERQDARRQYEHLADRIEAIMSEAMGEARDALGI